MSKVKTGFFCSQEKKAYAEGDNYTGKRTDLKAFLEAPKKAVKKIEVKDPVVVKKVALKKAKKK